MKRLAALLLLVAPLLAEDYTLVVDGRTWNVAAVAPLGVEKRPLVVVLHGAGGSGQGYLDKNGWRALAEREGFVVIAPDGQPARPGVAANFLTNPRLWNAGNPRAGSPRTKIDDVAFIGFLLDDAVRRFGVDPKRVYFTGHSNGAAMCFLLAMRMPGRMAAMAPVASIPYASVQRVPKPVPTLYFLGRVDPLVPFAGGTSRLPWGTRETPAIEPLIAQWAEANGCPSTPVQRMTVNGVERRRYCAAFQVVIIDDQGHGWPGGLEGGLERRMLGPASDKVDATREIWRFFEPLQR